MGCKDRALAAQNLVSVIGDALNVPWKDGKTFNAYPIQWSGSMHEFKVNTWGELIQIGCSDPSRAQGVVYALQIE